MVQVPTGIISALAHPPYGVLSREVHGALTAGAWSLQRVRGLVNVDAFGISFDFFTIPAAFGWTQQVEKVYELPIVEFQPQYKLFDGHVEGGEVTTLYHEGALNYFDQLLPQQIDVWVQVGCVVIPYWVIALA
jgi:hypothetical protein